MAGVWTRNLQGLMRASAIGFAENGYATIYGTNGQPIETTKPSGSDGNMYGFLGTNIFTLHVHPYGSNNTTYQTFGAGRRSMLLAFGSGDDTPSVNDYRLESSIGPYISTYSDQNYSYANGVASRTVTVTVQNQNVADMTIREWGLYGWAGDNPSTTQYTAERNTPVFLLYRALLDTPVTLQQYESATFTLTLQMTIAAES